VNIRLRSGAPVEARLGWAQTSHNVGIGIATASGATSGVGPVASEYWTSASRWPPARVLAAWTLGGAL